MDGEKVKKFFEKDRFAMESGVVIDRVSDGEAEAHLDVDDRHLNANGTCQGGAIFTLADTAMAAAANSTGTLTVSVQVDVKFVAAAGKGRLSVIATGSADSKKLPVYIATVFDADGNIIATFSSLFYKKKQEINLNEI
ncbi:MAG: PaaI family thioesterase [Bacteroidales bacterium]|nr:PaaI family thioesterase [Bacteroidales bacterium]